MKLTFKDLIQKSFLDGWSANEIGTKAVVTTLCITAVVALYIFFIYRVVSRKNFYSNTFNISLCGTAIITAAIIITIQSNVVLSLGMVGALSIVRFRTAIKDPLDLMFLFWSISVGIICGAGHAENAFLLSILMTIGVFVLDYLPTVRAPKIVVVNTKTAGLETPVTNVLGSYCKYYRIKSRSITDHSCVYSIEVRVKETVIQDVLADLMKIEGLSSVSVIDHNGEINC